MWVSKRAICAAALLLLLCSNGSLAAPPEDTRNMLFRFDRRPEVVKARIGDAKLQRILQNQPGFANVNEMVKLIAEEDDLGVDVANEKLIYKCMKPAPPRPTAEVVGAAAADDPAVRPVSQAEVDAKLAEAEAAASMPAAVSTLNPATYAASYATAGSDIAAVTTAAADPLAVGYPVDAVNTTDLAASYVASEPDAPGHHHHHHHRRRNLLQSAEEWLSPWHPDTADSTTISTTDVFRLHSRPGATRRIFLDFNGHTVTGTAWNVDDRDPIVMRPYDTDNSPTTWSQAERNQILAVWRGVAEDFAPWDVDVTTEDPGASYPLNQYVRHVIGVRPADYSTFVDGAAGVAYLNVWGASDHYYQPSFTFAESNNYDTKALIETASHELGHNFNLNHDGTTSGVEYYQGGNGWAPIMGFSDYQPITQWSKGNYPGANNKQDDLAIIGGFLPLVPNVHGTNNATATPVGGTLAADGVTMNAKVLGIIRSRTDIENMWFEARAGPATFEVLLTPSWSTGSLTRRTNMYVVIAIYGPSGAELRYVGGYGVPSFTLQLATPGRHLVRVFGLYPTTGNWATAGDFDDYASVGSYQLKASYQTLTATPSPSPSPSPKPSPSPSPPPATTRMTVHSFVGRKTISSTSRVTCSVDFTVVDNVNAGVVVSGASVTGRWSSVSSASGFPTATQTVTTNAAGVATFTFPSTVTLPASTQGCIFTISGITKSGVSLAAGWTKVARMQW